MAETVATTTPETTEPVAPKTETPREDFNTMSLEDLKKIVEEKLERVPAPNKKALDDAVAAIEKQIADLRARFDEIKVEKSMIFEGYRLKKVMAAHSSHL